jgi:hypothetical protein
METWELWVRELDKRMKEPHDSIRSQLFLVRLWEESTGDNQTEWHGRVQHVLSGEAHSFVDWPKLIDLFVAMLQVTHDVQVQRREAAESHTDLLTGEEETESL